MSTTIDRLKLFPETVGTHSNEDGIGTYHDRHATSVVDRNAAAKKRAADEERKKRS